MVFRSVYHPPCRDFWLRNDALGRHIQPDCQGNANLALLVGFGSTVAALVIGVVFGGLAGYYGIGVSGVHETGGYQLISFIVLLLVATAVIGQQATRIAIFLAMERELAWRCANDCLDVEL